MKLLCTIDNGQECLLSAAGEVRQPGNCVICRQVNTWLSEGHRWVLLREDAGDDLSAVLLSGRSEYPSEQEAQGCLIVMRLSPSTATEVRACINMAVQSLERVTIEGHEVRFTSTALKAPAA
ncbi:MAG: hypothetical protein SFV54_23980 [Bryobacteraceae bacterium]|nr:hypothetical protein [Bryobacteraceae bacterium]